jgi:hypothetical protein
MMFLGNAQYLIYDQKDTEGEEVFWLSGVYESIMENA